MNEALQQRLLKVFEAEHAEHLACMRELLERASQAPLATEELNEIFRRAHSLKGAARAVGLEVLQQLAHQLESLLQAVRQGQQPLDATTRTRVHRCLDFCENWLQARLTGHPTPDASALSTELESAINPQPPAAPTETQASSTAPQALSRPEKPPESRTAQAAGPATWAHEPEHVRLSTRRLEQLLEQAEALQLNYQQQQHEHTAFSRMLQGTGPQQLHDLKALWQRQHESHWQQGQRQQQLAQTLRQIRLLPARQLFQIFPKMVRELAQEQGKEIELVFSGLDQAVDRTVLQGLKDPIMHILRNAVGHGIENPAERLQAGKAPQGQIHCSLSAERHQLCIRIQDDGRGLNRTALKDQSGPQSVSDWAELLFQPGFSTAQQVNSLQGRGMGLSVVAEAVRKLQGTYRLLETGTGFGLELRVPLQIASIPLLVVRAGGHTLALPGQAVQRLLRSQPEAIVRRNNKPCLAYQSDFIPCYALSEVLASGSLNAGRWLQGVLLQTSGESGIFWVDEILHYREALLKPLSGPAGLLPEYLGAVLSSTGQAIPVLDPLRLLQQAGQQLPPLRLKPLKKAAEAPLILVVDDSITTRTLEKSILESQGYRVTLAVNGQEALEMLRDSPVDLVVSDLQMPVMDGMTLLRAIKADTRLQHLPVIIVTSVEDQHTRHEGLHSGASAYLVKQKFDQQELLSAIEALL